MKPLLMSESHQTAAPWAARLGLGAAATLAPARVARWLLVDEGCVWATRSVGAGQAEDLWIGAGQSLALPAGSAWVLEGWPQAQVTLAQQARLQPPAAPRFSAPRRAWWQPPWGAPGGAGARPAC
jgi:hypothetical protein